MKLIGYLTSGYPNLKRSYELAEYYIEGGCNMLEVSLPLVENQETPFLSGLMQAAYAACPDYDAHLQALQAFCMRHSDIPVTILLYDKVARQIGPEKLARFCSACGIRDVNTAAPLSEDVKQALDARFIQVAGYIHYGLTVDSLQEARDTDGFVYVQAYPQPGQALLPDVQTTAQLIGKIRAAGIVNPLYCGGGIRTVAHAKTVRDAGADGVFLGSAIIELYDRPVALVETIRAYRDALK